MTMTFQLIVFLYLFLQNWYQGMFYFYLYFYSSYIKIYWSCFVSLAFHNNKNKLNI